MKLKRTLIAGTFALGATVGFSSLGPHFAAAGRDGQTCYTIEIVQAKFFKGWYKVGFDWFRGEPNTWYPLIEALGGSGSGELGPGAYGLPTPEQGGDPVYYYRYESHELQVPSTDCETTTTTTVPQTTTTTTVPETTTTTTVPETTTTTSVPETTTTTTVAETTTTTTVAETTTTTTVPETTTTVPRGSTTTTTVPDPTTTTVAATTTTVASAGPTTTVNPTTSTSTSVAQGAPPGSTTTTPRAVPTTTGTPQGSPALPATGSNTGRQLVLGSLLLGAGVAVVASTRRRPTDTV